MSEAGSPQGGVFQALPAPRYRSDSKRAYVAMPVWENQLIARLFIQAKADMMWAKAGLVIPRVSEN